MDQIISILRGTPWWVYLIFVYLIYRGVRALKPQVMSIKKIFILPILFIVLSVYRLASTYQGYIDVVIWLFFLIIGYVAGMGLTQNLHIKADKRKLLIGMPQSPVVLILVILIFSSRYFFGYYSAIHPEAHQIQFFHWSNILTSALFTGIFLGRFSGILNKFGKASHTKLKEDKS